MTQLELDYQPETETHRCPVCNASMKKYWHRLTPMLVKVLVKMYTKVVDTGKNSVEVREQLDLDKTEYNNFQKLRFHALVAKTGESGKWLITRRGSDFLKGKIEVPARVLTFRNKVVDHDYSKLVSVKDVIGSNPYVESIFDYEIQS